MNGLMRVLGVLIEIQSGQHTIAQLILREHPVHRLPENLPRILLHLVLKRDRLDTTRVTAEMMVHLIGTLVPGDNQTIGIDDHDTVTTIDMRRVPDLLLSGEHERDLDRQTAKYLSLRIELMIHPAH